MIQLNNYIIEKLKLDKNLRVDNIDEYCLLYLNSAFYRFNNEEHERIDKEYKLNKVYSKKILQYVYIIKIKDAKEIVNRNQEEVKNNNIYVYSLKGISSLQKLIEDLGDGKLHPWELEKLKF